VGIGGAIRHQQNPEAFSGFGLNGISEVEMQAEQICPLMSQIAQMKKSHK